MDIQPEPAHTAPFIDDERERGGTHDNDGFVLPGELLVLVGPSGCGKTTALRMIAGLEEVTAGEIRIGDRVVNDVPPRERDIAMVFQNYALYPHMTVAQNIGYGLRLRRMPKPEIAERVRTAARMLDLEEVLDRRPKHLSGGQRQRVAMGRAIVRQPRVFLMDEPLSNLDAKLRVQMRADIGTLQRELRTTTVYVTHDQVEAMTLGDRVAVMRDGVLQQVDTPHRMYDEPRNVFVAGFIGSPAMNLALAAVADGDGAGLAVDFAGQRLRLDEAAVAARPALRSYVGRDVVLGVRPEDVEQAADASPGGLALKLPVAFTEALGSQLLVHLALPEARPAPRELTGGVQQRSRWVAALRPRAEVRDGELAELTIDPRRLQFFDPGSGETLAGSGARPRSDAVAA